MYTGVSSWCVLRLLGKTRNCRGARGQKWHVWGALALLSMGLCPPYRQTLSRNTKTKMLINIKFWHKVLEGAGAGPGQRCSSGTRQIQWQIPGTLVSPPMSPKGLLWSPLMVFSCSFVQHWSNVPMWLPHNNQPGGRLSHAKQHDYSSVLFTLD